MTKNDWTVIRLASAPGNNSELARAIRALVFSLNDATAALSPLVAIKADDGDDFSKYPDECVIRCEITAGEIRKAREAWNERLHAAPL